ncbi:hypothetical protein TNCV_3294451 [Trichonephila clavipes]|nr:hypothetical protein TNCV_3294451 [Trichonephila clavipes]
MVGSFLIRIELFCNTVSNLLFLKAGVAASEYHDRLVLSRKVIGTPKIGFQILIRHLETHTRLTFDVPVRRSSVARGEKIRKWFSNAKLFYLILAKLRELLKYDIRFSFPAPRRSQRQLSVPPCLQVHSLEGGIRVVWHYPANDEAHFWLNGYVNKQNCRIWSEANPQVYVETPLHPEKLTVWCALWAGGILLQKR